MTPNMENFIYMNQRAKIYEGFVCDKNGKYTEKLDNISGVCYKFTNGEKAVLLREDVQSAPDFKPKWDFGEV